MHPLSLQGFLHWLRRSGAEVKREAESAGNLVRVMTVHGAKGLQAPLVILPDTTSLPPDDRGILWATDPATRCEVPIWSPRREIRCLAAERLREVAKQRRMEEHNRLLYVALTRAEDRLLVCGWETRRGPDDACWYRLVERGFDGLPEERAPFAAWDGEQRRYATPQRAQPGHVVGSRCGGRPEPLPRWAGASPDWRAAAPPDEPARTERLAPSRPENVELGPVPAAATPLAAREADRQPLPAGPPAARAATASAGSAEAGAGGGGTGMAGPARQRPGGGRGGGADGRGPGDPRPSLTGAVVRTGQPRRGAADRPGGRRRGRRPGGSVGRAGRPRADRRLQDQPASTRPDRGHACPVPCARWPPTARCCATIFPGRAVVCALVWTQSAQVVILPDELLDLPAAAPT